jgi:hypothetical protein
VDVNKINRKDLGAGALFIAVGSLYGGIALQSLPMNSAREMGPGYMPVILASIVVLIGLAVVARSFFLAQETPFGKVAWRPVIMLSLATIVFAGFLDALGLLPAVFVTAFIACLSTSQITYRLAALISLGLAVFCTLIFGYGVGLPIPLLGSWFGY